MNEFIIEILTNAIIEKYGEINEFGCYSFDTREWLSTQAIVELITETINNYDFDE